MSKKGIIVLLIVANIVILFYTHFFPMMQGDQSMREGRYEAALAHYQKVEDSFFIKEKAQQGIENARRAIAEEAVKAGDYDRAITLYEELKDDEQVQVVRRTAADAAMSDKDYARAAELYQALGETLKANDAWLNHARVSIDAMNQQELENALEHCSNLSAVKQLRLEWGDRLMEKGEYDLAIKQYNLIGNGVKAHDATIIKVDAQIEAGRYTEAAASLRGYAGEDIADRMFRIADQMTENFSSADAVAIAGRCGANLVDTDTQLIYCQMLRDQGLSLKQVYPEGVHVDADLAKYQYDLLKSKEEDHPTPNGTRVLVYSRLESAPKLQVEEISSLGQDSYLNRLMEKRKSSDYGYEVVLQAGIMDELVEKNRASSLADCTTILMFEKGYIPLGELIVFSKLTDKQFSLQNLLHGSTVKVLPNYSAYELITLYDKDNPEISASLGGYVEYPLVSDCVIGNEYSELGIELQNIDLPAIQQALLDPESEANKAILDQYDPRVLEMIKNNETGDYVMIPDRDAQGNIHNIKATASDISSWYIDKYMVGSFRNNWLVEELEKEDIIKFLSVYFALNGMKG